MNNETILEHAAKGRHIVNLCMFSWIAASAFRIIETPILALFIFGSMIAALVGMLHITKGLGIKGSRRFLIVVGAALPLIGLFVMEWGSSKSSKALRSAGYKVGMFSSIKGHAA
jgi:hypothetical protein